MSFSCTNNRVLICGKSPLSVALVLVVFVYEGCPVLVECNLHFVAPVKLLSLQLCYVCCMSVTCVEPLLHMLCLCGTWCCTCGACVRPLLHMFHLCHTRCTSVTHAPALSHMLHLCHVLHLCHACCTSVTQLFPVVAFSAMPFFAPFTISNLQCCREFSFLSKAFFYDSGIFSTIAIFWLDFCSIINYVSIVFAERRMMIFSGSWSWRRNFLILDVFCLELNYYIMMRNEKFVWVNYWNTSSE